MTRILLFLVVCPLLSQAQPDTLRPINSDLLPSNSWNGSYWQSGSRIQYTYDGLDIRAKDLGQYIRASGDPTAIREFKAYMSGRRAGGFMIGGGIIAAIVGTAVMGSNGPGSDGKFIMQQPITCPTGNFCGGALTGGKAVRGTGQVIGYEPVTDIRRRNAHASGFVTLLTGGILTSMGWAMRLPGPHLRRSVQYYNRALKQQGVSWQLMPYSGWANSGVGLVGRF